MPIPSKGESREEFLPRCISILVNEGFPEEQAIAICETKFEAQSAEALVEWRDDFKGSGILAMGIVDDPANQSMFTFLNNHNPKIKQIHLKLDEEKRLIVGAALIPELPIWRNNNNEEIGDELGGYYAFFTKERICNMAHDFMARQNNVNVTSPHQVPVKGVSLVESWVTETVDDKINTKYGYQLPIGTWCLMYHVENDKVWTDIKAGKLNGFSIEGLLSEVQMDEQQNEDLIMLENLIKQIMLLKEIISFDFDDTLTKQKYQDLASKLISEGDKRVIIVTARQDKDMTPVYELASKLGINKSDVFNTNGKDKYPTLQDIGVSVHYDNNQEQIDKINENTDIKGILAK